MAPQPAARERWVWAYLTLAYLSLAVYAGVGGHLAGLPGELRHAGHLVAEALRLALGLHALRP